MARATTKTNVKTAASRGANKGAVSPAPRRGRRPANPTNLDFEPENKREYMSSEFMKGWKSVKQNKTFDKEVAKTPAFRRGKKFASLHPEFDQIREGTTFHEPAFKEYLKENNAGRLS